MEDTLKFLFSCVRNIVKDQEKQCDENTLLEDIPLDSLSFVSFIVKIEENYNFEFDDDFLVMEKFKNLTDVAKYINKKLTEKGVQ